MFLDRRIRLAKLVVETSDRFGHNPVTNVDQEADRFRRDGSGCIRAPIDGRAEADPEPYRVGS